MPKVTTIEKNTSTNANTFVLVEAILLSVIFLCLILFSSPIFRVLGFEYSTIASVVLSLLTGVYSASESKPEDRRLLSRLFRRLLPVVLLLAIIPLILSLFGTLVVPNCALMDGILFYLSVALPGALLGSLFGVVFGLLFRTRSWRVAGFILFWILTFILSVIPGYTNPQIFTYGWQYGFFPGFVWDSALELTSGYYYFRVENFILAALLLNAVLIYRRKKANEHSGWYWISLLLLIASMSAGIFSHNRLRITSDHDRVEKFLSSGIYSESGMPSFVIRYRAGSLSQEEIQHLKATVFWDLYDLRERLGLKDSARRVSIYIYPSSEAMQEYVGTGSASISKPWLSELHIAKENLESLKHELTHVVLREVGAWPFGISWSTGITEGVAMAEEYRYDGLRTLDEHAARILQMHLATGVQDVMSFSGFASNASQKSYVLAGSFAKYLLRTYGAPAYIRLYTSLDYQQEYHRSLPQLETEWMRSLRKYETPMNRYDTLRTKYFFGGTSIIFEPCVRRIGKLENEAHRSMSAKKYLVADSLYALIVRESGSVAALGHRATALMDAGNYRAAEAVLDTTRGLDPTKMEAALSYERGDVAYRNGDTARALFYFGESTKQRMSDKWVMSAYVLSKVLPVHLNGNPVGVGWKDYFDTTNRGASLETRRKTIAAILEKVPFGLAPFDSLIPYYYYLYAGAVLAQGEYSSATTYLAHAATFLPQTLEDSLLAFEAGLQVMAIRGEKNSLHPPAFMRNAADQEIDELTRKLAFLQSRGRASRAH